MPEATSAIASRPQLVRAIGRWSLVALTVNCVIGSGVFGLPSELARLIGGASVLAVVLAAAVVGVVMACFAEVSSQFTETGGPYLYVRAAFGRLMGIEVGWLIWVVRIASCAARAFYLLATRHAIPVLTVSASTKDWSRAILLLIFAYGGFEAALISGGEAKDPRRDMVFALFSTLVICAIIYSLIQWVVVGVLPDPAHSARPLADVARVILGHSGAVVVALGALVSVYGYLSANIL